MTASSDDMMGYAFISYAREDSEQVDRLESILRSAGIQTWRDTHDVEPGDDWEFSIRAATSIARAFLACFSTRSTTRPAGYQNAEILQAIDQIRLRRPEDPWFIPIRLDDCQIPDRDIGGGRRLSSFQYVDMFGAKADESARQLVNRLRSMIGIPESVDSALDEIYRLDQFLVAESVKALREGASRYRRVMDTSPLLSQEIDVLGPQGTLAFGGRWDVLQNYAEQAFPEGERFSREIIDASYDPVWRQALSIWAEQNVDRMSEAQLERHPAFNHASALDLESYLDEFNEPTATLERAYAAGRLPCSPDLVVRSPELALLAMRIWRIASSDSALVFEREDLELTDPLTEVDIADERQPRNLSKRDRAGDGSGRRLEPQAQGDLLERSVLDVLTRLFTLDATTAQRLKSELRRQRSGTQFGTDIIFRAKSVERSSTCLVECKNYQTPITVSMVAEKVLQAEAAYDAEPVDHWILISPHQDPGNELDRLVQSWNTRNVFPFKVQIWSPQSRVRDLFSIDPEIYRGLYGTSPDEDNLDRALIVSEFTDRIRPTLILPSRLKSYISDRRSFVEPKEFAWLEQLDSKIERYGFDDKGARLERPLQVEILSFLSNAHVDSNVALLLGEFGEGKSFFTVSLCVSLMERYLDDPRSGNPIPLRLLLRGYRDTSSPADFLRLQLEQKGLSMEDWPELVRRKVLIILDGLDEMSVRMDSDAIRQNLEKIESLLQFLEGLPVLVTSRPHFFSSASDRERFYDRLRRPRVFWMGQPDRRETISHLREYADSLDLTEKLNRIKELYDPIGLAGKVLFLEMIKETLPNLPEDRFDEVVLYETYVQQSLKRKIHLLRDPYAQVHDSDLKNQMEELLERIAIAIHIHDEGSVDLRDFVAESGSGAARLLWKISDTDDSYTGIDEDAASRIGGRSLLRRVSKLNANGDASWSVDFFHRSMKEYFIAKALHRSLTADDAFAATRNILIHAPIQPEILGFFRLLCRDIETAPSILASLAHSARLDLNQGSLGGGAISLYYAIADSGHGIDWRNLDLDGAILVGADLSGADLRGSTLKGADLSMVNLTDADIREADLTDSNLSAGGSIISLSNGTAEDSFLCLTPNSEFGLISFKSTGSLYFTFVPLPRSLRSPRGIYSLGDGIALVVADSEFLILGISEDFAEEIAYFRVPGDVRSVAVIDQSFIGLILEPERGLSEAILIDIDTGQVIWRIPVSSNGNAFGWTRSGVAVAYGSDVACYSPDSPAIIIPFQAEPSGHCLSLNSAFVAVVTEFGGIECRSRTDRSLHYELQVHNGTGSAIVYRGSHLLTSGSDGSIVLVHCGEDGTMSELGRLERRLRCAGAMVDGLKRERERQTFLANGAVSGDS